MNDMTLLFARDPLKLSDTDIDQMIAHMRENRKNFEQGDKVSIKKKTPAAGKRTGSVKLEDVGVEL